MTFNELMNMVLEILPDALLSEDKNGEVVISTGFSLDGNSLVPLNK